MSIGLDPLEAQVYLAIDAGTEWAGYAVGHGGVFVASGRQNIKDLTETNLGEGSDIWDRVSEFGAWSLELYRAYNPTFLVIELPMGDHGNRHTDRVMGACLGVLLSLARSAGLPRILCTPNEVKQTGYHKNALRDAALLVGKPLDEMTEDEADALGLGMAGALRVRNAFLAGRLDFSDKFKWPISGAKI